MAHQTILWLNKMSLITVILLLTCAAGTQAIPTQVIRLPASTPERSSDLLLDCNPASQVDWYFQAPGMSTAIEVNTLIHVNMYGEYLATGTNHGMLRINGVRPRNEGLYYCQSGGEMVGSNKYNITVLGTPSFVDCSTENCPSGPPIIVNEGDSFEINASLVFKFAGPRNENQDITLVRVEHFTEPIFYCPANENFCNVTVNYTDRITHTGQRSPWKNISVTVSNSVLSDNGTYRMLLRVLNPNGQLVRYLTSSAIVSVTQGTVCATPTSTIISPSTSLTNSHITTSSIITSSPVVLPTISSSSSKSSVLVMTPSVSMTPSPGVGNPEPINLQLMIVAPVLVVGLLVLITTAIIVAVAVVVNRRSIVQLLNLASSSSEVYENRLSRIYDSVTVFKKDPNASLNDNLNSKTAPV